MEEAANKNERIVLGGATAFPRMQVRPPPASISEAALEACKSMFRGSFLAAALTVYVYPSYELWLTDYLQTGGEEERAFSIALTVVHVSVYAACMVFFETLDYLKVLRVYKLARTRAHESSPSLKIRTVLEFSVGQVVNFYLGVYAFRAFGAPSGTTPLPPFWVVFRQMCVCWFVNTVSFCIPGSSPP
jgi:hypothetical protein